MQSAPVASASSFVQTYAEQMHCCAGSDIAIFHKATSFQIATSPAAIAAP
jgi:hypothetical protein